MVTVQFIVEALTLLRPAGSWKQAAPVFAKGDFCRDG